MMAPHRISPADTKAHEEIHALLHMCFAYMEGRIDPPSSLHRLSVQDIARQCKEGEVWAIGDPPGACVFFTPKSDVFYLGKMAVAPDARGQGHARRLVTLAEQRAALLGKPMLELQTRIELVENHETFRKLGFRIHAYGKHPGFEHVTDVTMRKPVQTF
ncbi:MAG: GNAT family N-acetyltransferase [Pseudomonadota bacterium]